MPRSSASRRRSPHSGLPSPAVVLLVFAAAAIAATCRGEPPAHLHATVLRIVDGDTFAVTLPSGTEERVRPIGIDAPEASENPRLRRQTDSEEERTAIIEMGTIATAHAEALLPPGASVDLVFDPVNTATQHRDRYGRLLAYVYVLDETGRRTVFFNERMIRDGYAAVMSGFPYDETMRSRFQRAYRTARREQRGLWSRPDAPAEIP